MKPREWRYKMMKKIALAVIMVLLISSLSFAAFSKLGTAGAQFLKIGVGARGAGMAGAFSAVADGASALYWNPACAALLTKNEVFVSDVEWVTDVRNNFISYVKPMGLLGNIGFGLTVLSMGEMDVTTVYEPDGTGDKFGANDIAAALNFSKSFTNMFSFGINMKWVQENIWDMQANGLAFDFGTLYRPDFVKNLKLAFVMTNFGPDMVFKGGHLATELKEGDWQGKPQPMELSATPFPLPMNFKIGLAYDAYKTETDLFTIAVDASHPNDSGEIVRAGLEYTKNKMFSLRGGYKFDQDLYNDKLNWHEGFAFGFGVNLPIGGTQFAKIDYAGEDLGRLSLVHRISLGFVF